VQKENRTTIRQIYRQPEAYYDKRVSLSGWIRSNRDSKLFGFIELNDGSFFKNLQIVYEDHSLENFKDVIRLGVGTALAVEGILVETPGAKQPFEIKAESIKVEGPCPSDYPLQKKRHSFEFLRSI
jgi:asparaginyl-tRNA synthetase